VSVRFTARISVVGRSGQIKYKFVRSDRSESLPQDLVFDGPGTREVTDIRDVSKSGWVEVQVLEPVSIRSNRAVFTVNCEQATISDSALTVAQLREIMPNSSEQNRALYLPYIEAAMKEYGINTPLRRAAFLAEVAYNTVDLKALEELGTPDLFEKQYGQRKDLGNFEPGDGARYKGRGAFATVGRSNYQALGELMGVDLVKQPELLATAEIGFRAAALYWYRSGCNELAEKEDIVGLNRRLTGGSNGLAAVKEYFDRAKIVLSARPPAH
jgi:putative chitinase